MPHRNPSQTMKSTRHSNSTNSVFVQTTPLPSNRARTISYLPIPPSKILCTAKPTPTNSLPALSRRVFLTLFTVLAVQTAFPSHPTAFTFDVTSAYDTVAVKNGLPCPLSKYKGKLTLFVNVATYCALTPQYAGLVSLYDDFEPCGFEIVASPCDQFGHQEPGSNTEICKFVEEKFGTRFLLLDKLNVNEGPGGVAPLYHFLRYTSPEETGQRVSWNFENFLVTPDGHVLRRYKPGVLPKDLRADISWALDHPGVDLPPRKRPTLGAA